MADQLPIIGSSDKGQFSVNMPRSAIQRVDVVDIDLVIQGKGGEKIILPGAAMDAMGSRPPAIQFSDGPMGASDLLSSVGKVQVPNTPIPAMASLTQFDQKLTQGRKNLTADGAQNHAAEAQAAQAAQVAPLQTSGNGSSVEDLVKKVDDISNDIVKRAFDPPPVSIFKPQVATTNVGGGALPTFKIPLYVSMVEGNVVGVNSSGSTIKGAGGDSGTTAADGPLPNDVRQYSTETITGTAGKDVILSDGFSQLANGGNSEATYQSLDKDAGHAPVGTPFYFAKEMILVAAGYVRSVSSVSISGLPAGVSIEGATDLGGGNWSLAVNQVFPSPTTLRLVYDITAVRALFDADSDGDGIKDYVDIRMKVTIIGVGTSAFTSNTTFILRFQDVDAATDITATGSGADSSFVYIMPTAGTPQKIEAGEGDNTVYGGNSADTISAGAGKDVIYGYGGNDVISAGDGDNTIWGGNGDDTITTGGGRDTIAGGTGNNTIVTGDGVKTVTAGAGNDSVTLGSTSGTDIVDLGGGANILVASSGATISLTTGSGNDTITTGAGDDSISAGAGNDTIAAGAGNNIITAGDGTKTITAGSGDDRVTVGSTTGIDVIDLGGGTNILVASSGAAISVTTGAGDDTITTGSGDDSISSGAGNDTIAAGSGKNIIITGDGDKTITTGSGADTITAGSGNNIITAGDGTKTITTGSGDDTVTVGSTSGIDVIDLGGGTNILVASSGAAVSVTTGAGNDTITTGAGDDSISAGAGADTIIAGSGNNIILTGDGNKTITTGSGADTITTGSGDDTITTGAGKDTIAAGSGNNVIVAGDGVKTITAGSGNDSVTVGSTTGTDIIDLGGGTNILVASSGATISVTTGAGNDTITTGAGDDSISAGAGNDTIIAGAGDNIIIAGDGTKTITAGAGDDRVTVGSTSGIDVIDLGGGTNILVASSGATISVTTGAGNDTIATGSGDDSISSGAGNDTIIAGAGANIIVTGDGDKAITTGSGNDTITTGAGSNVVWAGDGTNTVTGGGGADTLVGGTGADTLTGGGGADWFYAGTGANTVDGGTGDDWLSFNGVGSGVTSGTYSLANWLSNPGTDISGVTLTLDSTGGGTATRALGQVDKVLGIEDIIGSSGDDKFDVSAYTGVSHTLYGLDGNDVLIGGDMADTIYGGAGQDSIWGNAGNDVIYLAITGTGSTALAGTASDAAGAGTLSYSVTANGVTFSASNLYNIANGGAGADTIVGGDGNDLFISGLNEYSDGTRSDTFVGGAGNDVLDLSAQTIALKVDMTGGYATSGGSDVARFSDIEVILTGSGDDDITGSSGADTIYAGNGVNTVTAGGGNDIIRTGSGNDIIYAGQGSDTVWAGAGDDKIWANINTSSANGGSDTLFGGAGNDSLISSTTGTDTLTLYGEDDTTGTVGTNYTNTYFLYAAVERVYGATYSTDWITYGSSGAGQGTTYGVYVNLSDTNYGVGSTGALVQDATSSYWWSGAAGVAMTSGAGGAWSATNAGSGFYGHAQGDTYVSIENITGSNYADILIGNASNNVFYASTGNDGLYGLGGDDYFYITSGSKYVDGGTDNGQTATATAAGALTFSGGDTVEYSGNYSQTVNLDTVSHTVGTLTLAANQINTYTSGLVGVTPVYNVENYVGASGVDIVWGTDGDNRIDPRYGNDTVFAGGGNDVVLAGSGDAANVSTPSGADYLDGGSGIDWVSYAGISGAGATGLGIEAYLADADMNADGAADQIVSGTWAANTGYARFKVDSSSSQIDTLVNFENLQGSGQADILAGDAGANVIFGEAGNDTIYGGLGAAGVIDTLDGGAGSDLLSFYGYTLGVRVDMSTTNGLTILGNAGWSTATMTDGSTVAYLRNFENLRGSAQADTLIGSSGANIFYGSGGADTMSGGGGNDTFFLSSAQISQAAVLDGGANTDRVTATDTWTFSAGSFDTAKWISIEELYARNTAANNAFSLGAADIRAICDNGNNSSLTLYLDTGDKFTVATDAVGTSANYSFTNGGTLAAGSYSVVYKSGATSVATLTLQVA